MGESKKIKGKVLHKHEVEAIWNYANYIPEEGEIVIYDAEYDEEGQIVKPPRQKVGDGTHYVRDLPFSGGIGSDDTKVTDMFIMDQKMLEKYGDGENYINDDYYFSKTNWEFLQRFNRVYTQTYSGENGLFVSDENKGQYTLKVYSRYGYDTNPRCPWMKKTDWTGEGKPTDNDYPLMGSLVERRPDGHVKVPTTFDEVEEKDKNALAASKLYVDSKINEEFVKRPTGLYMYEVPYGAHVFEGAKIENIVESADKKTEHYDIIRGDLTFQYDRTSTQAPSSEMVITKMEYGKSCLHFHKDSFDYGSQPWLSIIRPEKVMKYLVFQAKVKFENFEKSLDDNSVQLRWYYKENRFDKTFTPAFRFDESGEILFGRGQLSEGTKQIGAVQGEWLIIKTVLYFDEEEKICASYYANDKLLYDDLYHTSPPSKDLGQFAIKFIPDTKTCGDIYLDDVYFSTGDTTELIPATEGLQRQISELEKRVNQGVLAYEISSDGTYYLVAGKGTIEGNKIVIPSQYKGLPVTKIKDNAFLNNPEITSFTIGRNVDYIGYGNLDAVTDLQELHFDQSYTKEEFQHKFGGSEGYWQWNGGYISFIWIGEQRGSEWFTIDPLYNYANLYKEELEGFYINMTGYEPSMSITIW